MHRLLRKLAGGDFRSIGRANEVAAEVLKEPGLFPILMEGLTCGDPLIRMRAADAAEKVSAQNPEWLAPFKSRLLNQVAKIDQQEVRWHAAAMFTRLELTAAEQGKVTAILKSWLDDKSRIVQTFSLQALADLSKQDPALRSEVIKLIEAKSRHGPPSVRARSKKLLKQFNQTLR
jgi:hypothetical protein